MTLTAADVAEIMRLVEQSGFDEMHLEIEGTKISLRRTGAADPVAPAFTVPAPTPGPRRVRRRQLRQRRPPIR